VAHPMMALYTSAALVVKAHQSIVQQECEYSAVHSYLSKLPSFLLDSHQKAQARLTEAYQLMKNIPPHRLQSYAQVHLPKNSPFNAYPYSWAIQPWRGRLTMDVRRAFRRVSSAYQRDINADMHQVYKVCFLVIFVSFVAMAFFVFNAPLML